MLFKFVERKSVRNDREENIFINICTEIKKYNLQKSIVLFKSYHCQRLQILTQPVMEYTRQQYDSQAIFNCTRISQIFKIN